MRVSTKLWGPNSKSTTSFILESREGCRDITYGSLEQTQEQYVDHHQPQNLQKRHRLANLEG